MGNGFSFDSVKANGFTNELTYRGMKQRSGVSYDYMDKLNQLVDQGIFVDKDGDGFTSAEKKALESEFFNLHTEKGYKTNFKSMLPGTSYDYSYDDFVRLAQAAGYVLKEEGSAPAAKKEEKEPDVPSEPAKADTPLAAVEEVKTPQVEEEEGFEPISQSGKQTLNDIASAGLPDGEYDIHFTGEKAVDANGNVVAEEAHGTVNGQKFKYVSGAQRKPVNPNPDAAAVQAKPDTPLASVSTVAVPEKSEEVSTDAPAEAEQAETVETAPLAPTAKASTSLIDDPEFAALSYDEKLQTIRKMTSEIESEIRSAERTSYTKKTKGFLGIGRKTKSVNYTAEELAQRQANLPQLKAELEEAKMQEVLVRDTQGQYWSGKWNPAYTINADGTADKSHRNNYTRVETADGRRIAAVDTWNEETHQNDRRYYSVKVAKTGDPDIYKHTYYAVVPNFDDELTDVELKK